MKAWRHYFLVFILVGVTLAMSARVVYLGVEARDFLQRQGDARSIRMETLPAYRGIIYDRNGEPLAVSTPAMSVCADPSRADIDDAGIAALAAALDIDPEPLRDGLRGDRSRQFMFIKRRASWAEYQQVRALHLDGIFFQREYRRYYPAAETAAHVVGLTSIDDRGLEGVELFFDDQLRGHPGSKRVLKNRAGEIIQDLEFIEAAQFGNDLGLSIDLRLQFVAARELRAAIAEHQATSGSIVMVDVHSGEILAMANEPTYNPNGGVSIDRMGVRNRAITDTYEPGSTMKPFTALAALESGRWQHDSLIPTAPGTFRVGRLLVRDPINRGTITLEQALQKSSQVAIAKVALDLDERAVYDVMNRIGLGQYMGIGLPGETTGTLSDRGLRNPVVRTTLAYGYGLALSPLHLAQAYLTLANGGLQMPLTIRHQDEPPPAERVIEEADARAVVAMLESVTAPEGTAPGARVPGYRIAGKSGTSRKVGAGGYDDTRHVALFAGIAPATDPRFVMVVVINEPRGEQYGGGAVSGTLFGRVAGPALRLLGVRPDELVAGL